MDPHNRCSKRRNARLKVRTYEVEWWCTLVHQVEVEGGRQDKEEAKGGEEEVGRGGRTEESGDCCVWLRVEMRK